MEKGQIHKYVLAVWYEWIIPKKCVHKLTVLGIDKPKGDFQCLDYPGPQIIMQQKIIPLYK